VLRELVTDSRLRSVLLAQRGDYGGQPGESSFGIHATIMRHYFNGGFYPVGGAQVFAAKLIPVIERAGGQVKLNAQVRELTVENGAVVGVKLSDATGYRADAVFSDAGAHNTVGKLLPAGLRQSDWAREVLSFKPSVCHLGLYLGLEGDIRASGATASNHWFYDTWDPDAMCWEDPFAASQAPAMFVSFPTLKDPQHVAGERQRHTAEIVVMTNWEAFSQWQDSKFGDRPESYAAFKALIERNLLAQFRRYFPALAPMIICHELSTPLSTAAFIGTPRGSIYGLETSPRRFLSDSLRARTPVPGLFLAGQDVVTPGVTGAMMGGVLAAATIEPKIFTHVPMTR
jgi:all-trans-retinol 13,14-reductase